LSSTAKPTISINVASRMDEIRVKVRWEGRKAETLD
jgi:hypothetical protein